MSILPTLNHATTPAGKAAAIPGSAPGSAATPAQPRAFAGVLARVQPDTSAVLEVRRGDTLTGLVKAQAQQQGQVLSERQAFRLAQQLAADNGIANPDRIQVGQRIELGRLQAVLLANKPTVPSLSDHGPAVASAASALASRTVKAVNTAPPAATSASPSTGTAAQANPVLEQTLQRAVGKGYLSADQLSAARERILAMAERYRFVPDDFARLSLTESGGLNPQASNGRCHGIIQFCDGPARGAASVGYRHNPRAILGLGLVQQLDLVDRYFAQVGLGQDTGNGHRVGLDELYLSVLTPASRSEKRPDAALGIASPQASHLHVDQNRQKPITRNSILQGLYAYTNALLQGGSAKPASPLSAATPWAQDSAPPMP